MQDLVTARFVECMHLLKEEGVIRSMRQFALSLGSYPQSLNEIVKGRRDVTIGMLRKMCDAYNVNPAYMLNGVGSPMNMSTLSRKSQNHHRIPVICAHQYEDYAMKNIDLGETSHWVLPSQWCGVRISIAFQLHSRHLRPSLESGDILFCREIEKNAWKSSIVCTRIFVFVTHRSVYIDKVMSHTSDGIHFYRDQAGESLKLSWRDICQVFIPQHKWSSSIGSASEPSDDTHGLRDIIIHQNESIRELQLTLSTMVNRPREYHEVRLAGASLPNVGDDVLSQVAT